MADRTSLDKEPRGLGTHSHGLASEFAHEQGWGTDEEQRTKLPEGKQATYGGTDYDYGAQDFGDVPVDESSDAITPEMVEEARKRLQE